MRRPCAPAHGILPLDGAATRRGRRGDPTEGHALRPRFAEGEVAALREVLADIRHAAQDPDPGAFAASLTIERPRPHCQRLRRCL